MKKNTQNQTTYLECNQKKRAAACHALLKAKDSTLTLLRPHSEECSINKTDIDLLEAKTEMKSKAEESGSGQTLRSVFREVTNKHSVQSQVTYNQMESVMQKRRTLTRPAIPRSAEQAREAIMQGPESYRRHFRHAVSTTLHGEALVFYSERAKAAISEGTAQFIQGDGTFQVVPEIYDQLFSIMVDYKGVMLPVGFALMTTRVLELYMAVAEEFYLGLGSNGKLRPTHGISDYEANIERALAFHFPELVMSGCQFHFSQSIYRRIKKLKLVPLYRRSQNFRQWARLVMGLPLVPQEQLVATYKEHLERETFPECVSTEPAKVRALKKYVSQHWLHSKVTDRLSVYHLQRRTSNEVESFHRWLRVHIPPVSSRSNFWTFVEKLNAFIDEVDISIDCLKNGLPLRRNKSKARRDAEEMLEQLKARLELKEITTLEYLKAARGQVDFGEESLLEAEGASAENQEEESEEEEEASDKENADMALCELCVEAAVKVVLLPCTHARLCLACSVLVDRCPSCEVVIADRLEIAL